MGSWEDGRSLPREGDKSLERVGGPTFWGGDSESKERPGLAGGELGNSLQYTTRMGDIHMIWEVLPARLQHSASRKPWLFTFNYVEEGYVRK